MMLLVPPDDEAGAQGLCNSTVDVQVDARGFSWFWPCNLCNFAGGRHIACTVPSSDAVVR